MNRIAMTNRLLTLASTVARDQVDRLQTAGPFNPKLNQIPEVLATGTRTTVPNGYPTNYAPQFPLFTDGTNPVVFGSMTTSVLDTGTLNTFSAVVRVQYRYGNRSFEVSRNVIRTAD
jgi:hypothetical protein